jgi:hypothetical protein
MAKYDALLKKLEFRPGRGGANARELVFVMGDEMAGFDLNFIVGIYDQTGDWAPGMGAHVHPFDEVLLFFGHNPNDMADLGADLYISLGNELEKHHFTVPTAVVCPKGLPHNPLVTEAVRRPFGHFHLALAAKYVGSRPPATGGTTDGHKYDNFVKTMPIKPGLDGSGARQLASFSGADLEGLPVNVTMGLYDKPSHWAPGTGFHAHPYNEALVFFGHDTSTMGYLGAELSIELGPEHERHTFDVPTVVSVPKGMPHSPVACNRVDKPYGMVQVGLGLRYSSAPAK